MNLRKDHYRNFLADSLAKKTTNTFTCILTVVTDVTRVTEVTSAAGKGCLKELFCSWYSTTAGVGVPMVSSSDKQWGLSEFDVAQKGRQCLKF